MKSKEEVIQDYWAAELRANQDKRAMRQQHKKKMQNIKHPTKYLGIFDEDGVMQIVPARPVTQSARLIIEVVCLIVFIVVTFSAASYITLYL